MQKDQIPVLLLGATGSVGSQVLDLLRLHGERFALVGLGAHSNSAALRKLACEFSLEEQMCALEGEDEGAFCRLTKLVLARYANPIIINAAGGIGALDATIECLSRGVNILLANKEILVVAGDIIRKLPGRIIPLDSEHSAIAQCLMSFDLLGETLCPATDEAQNPNVRVARIILTASGGPFLYAGADQLKNVTPQEAMAHPTWKMGRVISINSANLINKGMEVIEASVLFGIGYKDIDVVIHPESVVHSMVEFSNGSTIAQLSNPDMHHPIAMALAWPYGLEDYRYSPVDFSKMLNLSFFSPKGDKLKAIELAKWVGREGGGFGAVFVSAVYALVDAFCEGKIGFLDIINMTENILQQYAPQKKEIDIDDIKCAYRWATDSVNKILDK